MKLRHFLASGVFFKAPNHPLSSFESNRSVMLFAKLTSWDINLWETSTIRHSGVVQVSSVNNRSSVKFMKSLALDFYRSQIDLRHVGIRHLSTYNSKTCWFSMRYHNSDSIAYLLPTDLNWVSTLCTIYPCSTFLSFDTLCSISFRLCSNCVNYGFFCFSFAIIVRKVSTLF